MNKYFLMAKRSLLSRCPSYLPTELICEVIMNQRSPVTVLIPLTWTQQVPWKQW